ncbi:angiogenic factor with G patch and FHA domains 1 isoform X1 [Coccinella septempunctata]|uniref:angiogenic factor with G patch and FHA domains 1 isoform X1 n=1 Tax=Coccinella septempunctata TaxID=41139 RepID=UPI001D061F91|nr:angiogenic factor with G patch and FHA domains 1 isoform X1 [Coccinella septempunctata]
MQNNKIPTFASADTSDEEFVLTEEMSEKLKDLPQILEYIKKLLKYVEKYKKQIKKLKSKKQKSSNKVDAMVQTTYQVSKSEEIKLENTTDEPVKSITEDITKAAEQALQNSGFVYEETSGMYYDYGTGYYYNAEYGLYYDGNTGTYLRYNQETKSYEYHSQVYTDTQDVEEPKLKKHIDKRKKQNVIKIKAKRKKIEKINDPVDVEEGECSESGSSDQMSSSEEEADSESSEVAKRWPPCMRVIVEESVVPNLKKGSLHIITYEGGSIGREGKHSIVIADINISKHHLNILYNKDSNMFQAVDMGSRNGTLLNGVRMSTSKQESEHLDVVHGSRIQLGSTVLLCHVHEGSQTCGHCEPGLLEQDARELKDKKTKLVKRESHKKELQNLKKKFGMNNFKSDKASLASGYTDRAQKRREVIGSHNEHEKTQVSSLDESISSKNKGFQLLSKMGWKEGQSLGKEGQGILEPIKLVSNEGTTGVGSSNSEVPISKEQKKKKIIWKKTQERFDKLQDSSDIFEEGE